MRRDEHERHGFRFSDFTNPDPLVRQREADTEYAWGILRRAFTRAGKQFPLRLAERSTEDDGATEPEPGATQPESA